MSQGNGEIIDTPNEVYLDQYYAAREAIDRKALIDRAVRDVFRLNPAARAVCEYSLAEGFSSTRMGAEYRHSPHPSALPPVA